MFEDIVGTITEYPYLGVALVFLLCGMGLPLPEEIVLLAAGYVCAKFPDKATLHWMMIWCAGAILVGDLIPFVLGRVFGTRLLRLRWTRMLVTKQRLASFDRWFRRRGDMVILIARFLAGLRVVAFFTAGTMKMSWGRFLLLDGAGILLIVPLLTWLGSHSAGVIDEVIAVVQRVERGILWTAVGGGAVLVLWVWLWRRRRRRQRAATPTDTFVQPQRPVSVPPDGVAEPGPAEGAIRSAARSAADAPEAARGDATPEVGPPAAIPPPGDPTR
jgi:membrane protein DedA with SNARE-associated domain